MAVTVNGSPAPAAAGAAGAATTGWDSPAQSSKWYNEFATRQWVVDQPYVPRPISTNLVITDNIDDGGVGYGIAYDGRFLYLAYGSVDFIGAYHVRENGTAVAVGAGVTPPFRAYGMWADENFLYCACGTSGLVVYSVADNGTFTLEDSDDQGGDYQAVWGDGNFIYVACDGLSLLCYSVDADGILTLVDSDTTANDARDVFGDRDYIYVADGINGLRVYSVDAEGTLTLVDTDDQGGTATGVWASEDFIFLANGTSGLYTYSRDAAGTLTFIDSNDQGGTANKVFGNRGFIYLANGSGDLEVYTVDDTGVLTDFPQQVNATGSSSANTVKAYGNFVVAGINSPGHDIYIHEPAFAEVPYGHMAVTAGVTAETTVDATPRLIAAWDTDGLSKGLTVSNANNYITVPGGFEGTYLVEAQLSFSGTAGATFYVEIYKYDDSGAAWGATGYRIARVTDAAGAVEAVSLSAIIAMDSADRIGLYQYTATGSAMTVTEGSLVLTRIGA